mgnify:CR=1 FL=1
MMKEKVADLFEKCFGYTEAKEVMAKGLYPYFREISSGQDTEVEINGKTMLMLGSNSYMGLTSHPEVKQAAIEAIQAYGTGNAGSRFLNGTLDIHCRLEEKLADFFGTEAALLYGTGYMTNVGVIGCLIGPRDYIITDKMDHASIIDAARFSYGKTVKFKHNDMEDLERVLKICGDDPKRGKMIVVDGVFSMEGDIVKLPELVRLAEQYEARILVDDAHATGVLGRGGRGTPSHFGLEKDVDLLVTTFSKSFASLGGCVMASEPVIHYLKHHSRALIFSASMPPPAVATVSKALDIINREPERIEKLWHNTHKMYKGLKEMGYDTGVSETPIIPVLIGEMEDCFTFWRMLTDDGIFVNPVVPPAVPPGQCLIRTSYMATHTDKQLDKALDSFYRIGKKLKII